MDEHRNLLSKVVLRGLLVIVFWSVGLQAQTIRMVRTDVDSGRAGFITATQMFGVDILVSGVKNCTGVSFELQYQGSQYVVFSNWKSRDLGKKGTFAYDLSDTLSGSGSVHVGALSGVAITDPGIDNPRAVHLDFVVRPHAVNNTPVSFNFVHAQAVTSDSGGRIVSLSSTPYQVVIHGFVNVFPGDADNNGLVDSRDATTVGSFLKQGSGSSNVRGYKREPCSTLWLAQPALVWDSSKATYADCDGSGDVTLSDNLVVQINFGKVHSATKHGDDIQVVRHPQFREEYLRVPLSLNHAQPLLGAALEFALSDPTAEIVGFEVAETYNEVQCTLFSIDDQGRHGYLMFGSTNGTNLSMPGVVGSFVFARHPSSVFVREALGATSDGRIFPLSEISEVRNDSPSDNLSDQPDFSFDSEHQTLISRDREAKLSVSNVCGRTVIAQEVVPPHSSLSLSSLPSGWYSARFDYLGGTKTLSFCFFR